MSKNNTYPGFEHPANELIEFMCCPGFVVLAAVKTVIVRHTPSDIPAFRAWLVSHGIKDITDEAGGLAIDIYTNHIK